MRKSENVSMNVRKIENKDKMRDMNVGIKKGILVLILMMMIKSQRIINFFHLHN